MGEGEGVGRGHLLFQSRGTETRGQDIRIQGKNRGSRILSKLKASGIRVFRIKISHKVLFLGVTRCRTLAGEGE